MKGLLEKQTDTKTLDKVLEQGLDEDYLKYKDYLLDFLA